MRGAQLSRMMSYGLDSEESFELVGNMLGKCKVATCLMSVTISVH